MIRLSSPDCSPSLIGIPYGFRGAGGGLDCWQLLHKAALELYGKVLPDFADLERFDQVTSRMLTEREQWQRVSIPEPCDVAMFKLGGAPLHVGLVLDPPRFLHTLKGRESCIERYDSIAWRHHLEGFWRWPL